MVRETLTREHRPPAGADCRRVDEEKLIALGPEPAAEGRASIVCGPTGFVEHGANLLLDLGHPPVDDPRRAVRTERHLISRRR